LKAARAGWLILAFDFLPEEMHESEWFTMRHERLSTALLKEKRRYLLIVCALLLLCLSPVALAQSGRRHVKKESPPPTANVEAKTETEREKPKSDEGKMRAPEQPQRSEWQALAPAGEEFSILMPPLSDVYLGTRYMDMGFDRGQMVTVRIYRSLMDQTLFVIQSYEASDLKDLVDDVVKSNKQLSFGSDLKLNGFKGRSFSRKGLSIFSTIFGKGQYFITKKHLYIVEAARKGGDDPSLDRFLNSFNLGVSNPAAKLNVESIPQSNLYPGSSSERRKRKDNSQGITLIQR
jgi:hypothetical protein